jgi:predicted nucleotidyltransferase
MQEADLEIFKEFANRVHLQFPESKVWLFGSRARGDHYPDSYFDILVVIKDLSKANKRIISDLAWEVGFERNLLLAPIVYNFERFSYPAIQKSLFISNVMREGILA